MNQTTPPTVQPPAPPRLGLAIASLALGVLALLGSVVIVGALFGVIGLVLGLMHFARRQGRNGMALAGVILSVAGIVATIGFGALYFKGFKVFYAEWQKLRQSFPANVRSIGHEYEPWIGVSAPDFTVTTLDGQTIRLSELKGKRVVVDFWATWCPPCVAEIPHFIKLHSETPADQLVIVGISSEDEDTLKAFVQKKRINYPIASADNLPAPYKDISAIPTTFFIDRNGVIQSVEVGGRDFAELRALALTNDFTGAPKSAPPLPAEPPTGR